ncbi:hypothetical protein EGW08_015036 [Elysia chlorotica]|uniref:CUB domain-containing protein n=1 Tax=Elysia chlorotica TaxID=188477 RepID=A0A3S1B6G6_ELYCH|nr:hypothetical protein EGW08_015036 [Elysia chlorotica]
MFDFKKKLIVLQLCVFITIECQLASYCNEFISPKKLITQGSSVNAIRLPTRGNQYSRNQLCEWIIECQEGETIVLEVKECSIQARDILGQCNKDYVNIFDVRNGETVFMERFCGTDTGMVYQSSGSTMILRFFSDDVYEYNGFTITYRAEKADRSSGSSRDITMQLAVGIPVGILVTLVVALFTAVVCRIYHKRKNSHTSYLSNTASSSSAPPLTVYRDQAAGPEHLSNSAGAIGAGGPRVSGRGPPSWGMYRGQGYESGEGQDFPLQVALPEDLEGEGRSSPPPTYESLGYEDGAMTPPPYDAVVKESEQGPV